MKRRDLLKKAAGLVAVAAAAPIAAEATADPCRGWRLAHGTNWARVAMGDSLTHGTVTEIMPEGVWANRMSKGTILAPEHFSALVERIQRGEI